MDRRFILRNGRLWTALALLGVASPLLGEPSAPLPAAVVVSTNQLTIARREDDALRQENALLRKENRALRRQLVRGPVKGKTTEDVAPSLPAGKVEFWLSRSGKRHNAKCRYFKQGKGRPCTKEDGTPCKICGG